MRIFQVSGADAAHNHSCGAIALLPALTQRCRVSTRSAAPDFHPATSTPRRPPRRPPLPPAAGARASPISRSGRPRTDGQTGADAHREQAEMGEALTSRPPSPPPPTRPSSPVGGRDWGCDVSLPQTDLTSHHIEGIAVHGDTPFSVPLISHIEGNLWTGGCINGVVLPVDFRYVVSLYPWERYTLSADTLRVERALYDAQAIPDEGELREVAEMVNAWRRQGKTLVHCQAGLNRSALVAGYALILDGMPPEEAIALLRSRRCDAVLCNATFEQWLLSAAGTGGGR